jgi:hypothetical protein
VPTVAHDDGRNCAARLVRSQIRVRI